VPMRTVFALRARRRNQAEAAHSAANSGTTLVLSWSAKIWLCRLACGQTWYPPTHKPWCK